MKKADIVINDGTDNDDYVQNMSFTASYKFLESIHHKAAMIGDGGDEELDKLWKKSTENKLLNLPEDMYNHLVTYLQSIIDYEQK